MAKDELARFGVSLGRSLLKELDGMVRKKVARYIVSASYDTFVGI